MDLMTAETAERAWTHRPLQLEYLVVDHLGYRHARSDKYMGSHQTAARLHSDLDDDLRLHHPAISTSFSPDGKTVLTASEDGTARRWDAATGKELLRFG